MDENLSREFSAPNLSDLSDVTSEKSSESQDDSCLYKRSVSADDLRLLYRDWRQGQSQGVPWSALKKQKDDLGQTDSAISKNSIKQPEAIVVQEESILSPTSVVQKESILSALAVSYFGSSPTSNSSMWSIEGDMLSTSPHDIAILPGIPERRMDEHPFNELERKSQNLSDMFRRQSATQLASIKTSSSYENGLHVYQDSSAPMTIATPSTARASSGGMTKAMSYTGLSALEKKMQYFPSPPQNATGIQEGLKNTVTNDMCRAVVKQMIGEEFIHSSRGGKKILNHLYIPVLTNVQNHFKRLPARYALSVNPDDVPMHMRLLSKQERSALGIALHAQWCKDEYGAPQQDICEIVVVANDQDNLLDAITRSLTNLRGNILDADVMTTKQSVALDRFVVRGNFVSKERLQELKEQIEKMLTAKERAITSLADHLGVAAMIDTKQDVKEEWKIPLDEVSLEVPIGAGRSGHTYRAYWRGTVVAAKVINVSGNTNKDAALGDEILSEFYREVALVCRLRHPNVVLFLGASIAPPAYCLLFEYMERGTLTELVRSRKSELPFFRIARDVCLGMNYLHHCNIIHRDLKSSNILLDAHGTTKVSDFGLSCVFETAIGGELTAETGTYRWMAPEVIRHEPYTNKADVYSFGVVLWEMIAKEQPFRGMSPIQAAFAVARQKMRPALPSYTPVKLGELVEHCWHQNSEMRPTFAELIEVLPLVKTALRRRDFSKLGFTP